MVAVITTELLHNVAVPQTELPLCRVGYRAGAVGTGSIEGALELPQAILPTEVHALPVQEGFRGFDVHQLAHGAGFELILADLLRVARRCRFFGGFCTVGLGGRGLGSSEVLGGIGTEFLETDIITQVLHITITYNVVFTFTNLKKRKCFQSSIARVTIHGFFYRCILIIYLPCNTQYRSAFCQVL